MSERRFPAPDERIHELAARLRGPDGAQAALEDLDRLLRPRLLRYFSGTTLPGEDPEDLVQKTMIAVFRNAGGLEDPRCFLGWLFAIARNVRNTALEDRQRRERVEVDEPATVEPWCGPVDPGAADEMERRLASLRGAIERLPARQRQCLMLRLGHSMSYEEIAATLRLSANTVRNHLAQARESLRRQLLVTGEETGR